MYPEATFFILKCLTPKITRLFLFFASIPYVISLPLQFVTRTYVLDKNLVHHFDEFHPA